MHKDKGDILIILVAGIGDLVMASKGIRALRNGFPGRRIHLLTSSEAAPLAVNYPYLDRVWSFPIRELRKGKFPVLRTLKTILALRKIRFDLAVNLYRVMSRSGALKMGFFLRLIGAEGRVGHDPKGSAHFLDRKARTEIFKNRHFVDAMTHIALLAGGLDDHGGIEVSWDRRIEEKLNLILQYQSKQGIPRIGINPGADKPEKRWDPKRYASVADLLVERLGGRILIFGGP